MLSSANGEDALALLDRHDGGIDLMLTDIVMPGISGRELASRAATLRPGMPVLFTSDYTDDAIKPGLLDDLTHFISQPYTRLGLTAKVREVLGDAARAPATGGPA